jgi:hypothetical protein
MAMFGIGLDSSPAEKMKLTAHAVNAKNITSGNAPVP